MREEQIDYLFEEMTENMALSLLEENETEIKNYEDEVSKIEEELSQLGVQKLTDDELNHFLDENGLVSSKERISKPENTNTVKWYLNNYTNYTYNSKSYDVQRLIAVGNNPGGMLVTGEDNVRFFSNEEEMANAASTLVSIYVQKAIGTIPVISWTPYELLFSSAPSNSFNSNYVTHRCVSSIVFSFVKESSQSDYYNSLSFFSNMISIAVNTHGAAVVNSVPTTYSDNKSETISADYYSSISAAIDAYLGVSGCYNYISYYDIHSYDGKYSKKVYDPNPLIGPGQIY